MSNAESISDEALAKQLYTQFVTLGAPMPVDRTVTWEDFPAKDYYITKARYIRRLPSADDTPPEAHAEAGEIEIKPATLKAVNESAALQSVLYDNNLLPECVKTESDRDKLEHFVAGFMYAQETRPAPADGLRPREGGPDFSRDRQAVSRQTANL